MSVHHPWHMWSTVLRETYGARVHKISLDLGAGCPHREGLQRKGCIFCDARGGGSGAALSGISLAEQVRKGAETCLRRFGATRAILYFQSYSATFLPLEELRRRVEEALAEASRAITVVGVAVGTRPDLVPESVLDFLASLAERPVLQKDTVRGNTEGTCPPFPETLQIWLELGVQTTDPAGLAWLNRGHDLGAVEDAFSRARQRGLHLCAHLVAGIPGEAQDQLERSARFVTRLGAEAVKFHPLHVLRDTELERLYREGTFTPLSLDDYCRCLVGALFALPEGTIVQRLTADAHPPRLIAPEWIARKNDVLARLEDMIARRTPQP
ncbi:TIGR01212 family radical SAM protein [Aminiphilus circumscriptus]|uniref:TIGR01212 family radical SAM protein n=1 Tax=Aminiphilus circumscriptus TaxID=290732 RepID=UPI0004923595|nr:radical SAM protein [Aminiphilus circumscriptus]